MRECPWDLANAVVKLQTGRGKDGITDIEIDIDSDVALIIEAKKGPQLPFPQQLAKYANVLNSKTSSRKCILALTNASSAAAAARLECEGLNGSLLRHHSWREVQALAKKSIRSETNDNKRWLRGFMEYVGGLLEMEMRFSNKVFIVSLGGISPGWSISYREIVEKKLRYFFPVGDRWPDPPPNYMGFRYDGKLQSIHHVKSYDTFTRPSELFPEASPDIKWKLHYCVELGPAFRPPSELRNGPRIQRNMRVYCLLDTLFTNQTLSDALADTKARIAS